MPLAWLDEALLVQTHEVCFNECARAFENMGLRLTPDRALPFQATLAFGLR
eukprot:CAMPEP_0177568468 /NCGR_PEP_ID=MMETSP0369-20130122/75779_1 /TAXON_ID=447022 ORGANISM="Scrippsiella hangoei-like, Strain SHHI-4" /NCGR_SAMPLE_ID=MMETSP0369 /ASSEMBLY_ACC=CAM_ASM_000364 /LENGTH=50 /DNA_ID=CAMNT_0019056053 /DNA_START=40 /DNA_END=189 /DNA_ORIENTATION=-